MNQRIEKLLKRYVVDKEQMKYRKSTDDPYRIAKEFEKENLSHLERSVRRLEYMLEEEEAIIYPDERIGLLRTVATNYEILTEKEWEELKKDHYVHELGKVCNINPGYEKLINCGFDKKRKEIQKQKECYREDEKKLAELDAFLRVLDSLEAFAKKYEKEARDKGNEEIANLFKKIPAQKADTFQEALQFLRLIHYGLWCSYNYHNTLGRFDQYMYPYFKADMEAGRLDEDEALELVEEFFICCNKDSDLYPGMQQGDNGQSMVLGGLNKDGTDSYNRLSDLCLQASLELKLIDPKINVRVNKNTPVELYEKGTLLTKQGIGFPQYTNDDVVIQGLKRWGYDEEDAYNYVVAACWEVIIPGCGMDIPNINGLSFPEVLTEAMEDLKKSRSFEAFMKKIYEKLQFKVHSLCEEIKNIYMEPAPLMSLMMDNCIEEAKDISEGNKYNNFGFHGTGLSTAVDSLASIRKYIFQDKMFNAEELLSFLKEDFKGDESIQNMIRYESPKMGNDDDDVDELAIRLLDWFADVLEGRKNERGGIFRAGTGSAMYYVWQSKDMPATPDGRNKGEEFACNYSPSLFNRVQGPVSVIKSFSKPHLYRVANGGPLTLELHDTLFRNEDSIRKVALFIKSFIDMGGHQMQINAVNRSILLDAKKHPEKHRNLIVRVWGWSGYFVELDEVYQNQIIKRMEHTV
ncbi:MAG: pyruvate formate-lyase [Lachnospiraceae bacterium]|nr:pyruvate formate-lyase [Lachnospiraceae bacterium]